MRNVHRFQIVLTLVLLPLCALTMLATSEAHAQSPDSWNTVVEPMAGTLLRFSDGDINTNQQFIWGGFRLQRMLSYDVFVYGEILGGRSTQSERDFVFAITESKIAVTIGLGSLVIDPEANGLIGIDVLSGLTLLRSSRALSGNSPPDQASYYSIDERRSNVSPGLSITGIAEVKFVQNIFFRVSAIGHATLSGVPGISLLGGLAFAF